MKFIETVRKEKPHIQSLKDDLLVRKDPDFFLPYGTQVYTGRQGSGKTISKVKAVYELWERYKKVYIVSNLNLKWLKPITPTRKQLENGIEGFNPRKHYFHFTDIDELHYFLTHINNDHYGVIYAIDEIHTFFNALDSKNIPMSVFTEISQQRKQRKLILGTSQLFLRLAKPFREQCDNMIVCKTVLGFFTFIKMYDGMDLDQDYNGNLIGTVKKRGWYFHTRKIRNLYDTFQKVVSGREQYEIGIAQELKIDKKSLKSLKSR